MELLEFLDKSHIVKGNLQVASNEQLSAITKDSSRSASIRPAVTKPYSFLKSCRDLGSKPPRWIHGHRSDPSAEMQLCVTQNL